MSHACASLGDHLGPSRVPAAPGHSVSLVSRMDSHSPAWVRAAKGGQGTSEEAGTHRAWSGGGPNMSSREPCYQPGPHLTLSAPVPCAVTLTPGCHRHPHLCVVCPHQWPAQRDTCDVQEVTGEAVSKRGAFGAWQKEPGHLEAGNRPPGPPHRSKGTTHPARQPREPLHTDHTSASR